MGKNAETNGEQYNNAGYRSVCLECHFQTDGAETRRRNVSVRDLDRI